MKVHERLLQQIEPCLFGDWSKFRASLSRLDMDGIDHENVIKRGAKVGLDTSLYECLRDLAIFGWRDSCSRSLFDFLHISLDDIQPGVPVFKNILTQTRFIVTLKMADLVTHHDIAFVRKPDGKLLHVLDQKGYTFAPKGQDRLDQILQSLYLYKIVCQAIWKQGMDRGTFKTPQYLYRGQFKFWYGESSVFDSFKQSSKEISHYQYQKEQIDFAINHLMEHGVESLTDRTWMSMTTHLNVAKYFTDKSSFIIRIPFPRLQEVLTSERQDVIFDRKNGVSEKHEHEYVVAVDPTWRPVQDDFMIYDTYYLAGVASPLCIECLDHDNLIVKYRIQDHWVLAMYTWRSNTTGTLIFRNLHDDNRPWFENRRAFKQLYGFDPMPNAKRLDEVGECLVGRYEKYMDNCNLKPEKIFARSDPDSRKSHWFERSFS